MDVTSYLLGKKAGGGGGGSSIDEYFTTEMTNQNKSNFKDVFLKKMPPITLASDVTDLNYAFYYYPYTSIDLSKFNTENVTEMFATFSSANVTSLDVSHFDTSKVTTMSNMFTGCYGLTTIDISNFDTSNVIDMSNMFSLCGGLKSLDISGLNTSKVQSMEYMFGNLYQIETINMSGLDTSKVTTIVGMFNYSENLKTIIGHFDLSSCSSFERIFEGSPSVENLPTFTNIGKAFHPWVDPQVDSYAFDVSNCENLTHTSLMNIINGLYDIATAGIQTQKLVLGSQNIAKLSQAEQDMVTAKGWTLS